MKKHGTSSLLYSAQKISTFKVSVSTREVNVNEEMRIHKKILKIGPLKLDFHENFAVHIPVNIV